MPIITITDNEFAQLQHELEIRKENLRGSYENDATIKKLYPYIREQAIKWHRGVWNDADLNEIVGATLDRTLKLVREGKVIDFKSALRRQLARAMDNHQSGLYRRHRDPVVNEDTREVSTPRQFDPFLQIDADEADLDAELRVTLLTWWMHPETEMLLQQRNKILYEAMNQLSVVDRYIIWESEVKDRCQKEIAIEVKLKYDNVSKRKNRALKKLHDYLGTDFLLYYQL
jgi:RNA polymerase sigma factor (sigma-70 family)